MKSNLLFLLLVALVIIGCSGNQDPSGTNSEPAISTSSNRATSSSPREISDEYLRLCGLGDIEAVRQLITTEALARVDAVDAGDPCNDLPENFTTATFVSDSILNQNATTTYTVDWESNHARTGDQMTIELRLANRSEGWQLTALKTQVVRVTRDATPISVTLLPVVPLVSPEPNTPTEEP